jgi:Domain of unknown function (DUF5916)/Carbohydrate family 9 binding domain-like
MKCFLTALAVIIGSFCTAQVKTVQAEKIAQMPKLDGNLDDIAWKKAVIATDFIRSFPDFGTPAGKKTEVKILYDNTAIYVGAFMYDDRANIRRQLTQRDVLDRQDADVFSVGFDTYHDRQNAFIFQVSAAGVQGDARQSQTNSNGGDGPSGFDRSWDAVWESQVSLKENGWVAEFKIPFSALRFAKKEMQNWGVQFSRFARKLNEESSWSPINPNTDGVVNQWGDLTGLKDIVPPLRLSFLPYLSGGVKVTPTDKGNVTEFLKSGGMDVKYGINESFTLDMTLIPDFAQVRSDNIFLNLTPFQVRFDDFRPFFTEGTELFNKANLFYSRRIGAEPTGAFDVLDFASGNPNYAIEKNPGITRLYNATKLSGRTKQNLGIGLFNAVTAPMNARLRNTLTGKDSSILTEPLTNYNIIVLDKILKNRSSVTFTNTNVLRKGNARNANVSALDISLFDKENKYNYRVAARYSNIWGKSKNEGGYTVNTEFGKVSGKLQYSIGAGLESDTYDPNDLGFLFNNNSYDLGANINYNINNPTKRFLRQGYNISVKNRYLYKPFAWTDFEAEANAFVVFKNFWDVSLNIETKPFWFNDFFEARTPGVNLKRIPYFFMGINGSTDSRKKFFVRWLVGGAESEWPKDLFTLFRLNARYRFSDKLQVNASFEPQHDRGAWGFSHRDTVSTLAAGYKDPIVAFRDVRIKNVILGAQYNFTSRMNWNIRIRHNWTQLHNQQFYKVRADGYWNDYPFSAGRDRNFNAFNVDMFYTWDFKWGSRLTFAWKNALSPLADIDPYLNTTYGKNLSKIFNNPHSNELSLKIVYFLDYLTLKRKS